MTIKQYEKGQRPFLYRSLSSYLREIFGRGMRKVPLDPGFGCPNRDGTTGTRGCVFCNPDSFVPEHARQAEDVRRQLEAGSRRLMAGRGARVRPEHETVEPFIAYLQAGSATHAPPRELSLLFDLVGNWPGVAGLFIGTRPDCVDEAVIECLSPWVYRRLVWLELGLQSANDATLDRLGRGHDLDAFVRARALAGAAGIPVLAHVILGLPGEEEGDMMATARFLADQGVEGVKIHHLQIIRGTGLEALHRDRRVQTLRVRDYPHLVANFLERLAPQTVVHRLLAEAPEDLLVAPRWPVKARVLEAIRSHMTTRGTWQGRLHGRG